MCPALLKWDLMINLIGHADVTAVNAGKATTQQQGVSDLHPGITS